MHIITHRGLDPSYPYYFQESSLQAFKDQLLRGYGLEFDVRITKDKQLVVIHDETLTRFSQGKDLRKISDVTLRELLAMNFNNCRLASFAELLTLIEQMQSKESISAIHIKSACQNKEVLDLILTLLSSCDTSKFMLFDVTVPTATYLKSHNPNLLLAPSVAHPHDIERYNSAVGGTLLSLNEALSHKELFSWVWLDEWDLNDNGGKKKEFYTQEIFDRIKTSGLRIALVTPELHATSPNLLGGESHEDAQTMELLLKRFHKITALKPDALCTDYPDIIKKTIKI